MPATRPAAISCSSPEGNSCRIAGTCANCTSQIVDGLTYITLGLLGLSEAAEATTVLLESARSKTSSTC